jgi:hypothetical protein
MLRPHPAPSKPHLRFSAFLVAQVVPLSGDLRLFLGLKILLKNLVGH